MKTNAFSIRHAQWIVKTSGQFAESLIEISNWLVGESRSGVFSY